MEMQKSLGVIGEKIDRMREDFGDIKAENAKVRDKLVEVEKSIASANGALKVFGRLYALLLVVVAAFLAWFLRPLPTPGGVSNSVAASAGQPSVSPKAPTR